MQLLLVIPPQHGLLKGFATGIVSLAEYLEDKLPLVDIEIADLSNSTFEDVKAKSTEYYNSKNLFVGITTITASYQSALYTAQQFKRSNNECKVIFGGHHASADANIILKYNSDKVDYIIKGEGEIALHEFLKNYPSLSDCPNLVYIENDKIKENPSTRLLNTFELDNISLSYKETELYGQSGKFDTITYVSARGCPLRCSFCAVANQKMRSKSIQKVREDIEKLLNLGYNRIAIEDNFFAHSIKRTISLCKELEEVKEIYPKFEWDCQTRVESLKNKEVITAMEKAGCYAVYVGVEALNKYDLSYLGKSKNGKRYLEVLHYKVLPNIFSTKVDCYINLQLGLPKKEFFKQTITNLKRIGNFAHNKNKSITIFPMLHVVYPGTKHYSEGLINGLWQTDVFEHFTEWESEQGNLYGWLGRNFAHGTGGIPIGILNTDALKLNQFQVNNEAVLSIQNDLEIISKLSGISLFRYESYLN